MKRRLFLKTGFAAGLAGLATPSLLSGRPVLARRAVGPSLRSRQVPDPPYRLQFNENPRGLSPAAKRAIIENFDGASLYGSSARGEIVNVIAEDHGVDRDFIAMGNGSADTLRQAPQAIGAPGMHLVTANPTYGDIFDAENMFPNVKVTRLPERSDYTHDIPAMRRAAAEPGHPVTLVYICQPNNPTGTVTPQAEIDAWIEEADEASTYFVIDEAYHHYVDHPQYRPAESWVHTKRNVIICRTFSKIHAMAGLRLGYGIAHPDTASKLRELFGGGLSHLNASAGLASMEDTDWITESLALNRQAKQIAYGVMDELNIDYIPSQTNFFMHRVQGDLGEHRNRMSDQGILVGRNFPPMLDYNRVSVGLPEHMAYWGETLRMFRTEGWI